MTGATILQDIPKEKKKYNTELQEEGHIIETGLEG